jgi:hypothetical protein
MQDKKVADREATESIYQRLGVQIWRRIDGRRTDQDSRHKMALLLCRCGGLGMTTKCLQNDRRNVVAAPCAPQSLEPI